jgi:putative colanic acid biosynthesis acetyltransferase WcaF
LSSSAVDLSRFRNSEYDPGRPFAVRMLWFLIGQPLLRCSIVPSSAFRRALLTMFGARIGKGAVIKPGVRVKYPWNLETGEHCWIGEDAWLDNLAPITLGNDVCISQDAYLCTGNHDTKDPAFGLITRPIRIEDAGWVAARASIGPGVVVGRGAIVGFGAVATNHIPEFEIHAGNPAVYVRQRQLWDAPTMAAKC